jgi:hypothetical protein
LKLRTIATVLGVLVALGCAVVVATSAGVSQPLALGAGIGVTAAVLLMLLHEANLKRSLKSNSRSLMMGQILGGFLARLAVLVAGFFSLAVSGLGSPVAYALAFLAGVVVMLGVQVVRFGRGMHGARSAA